MGFLGGSQVKMQSVHLLYLHLQVLVFSVTIFEIMRILCINENRDHLPAQFPLLIFFCLTH